MKVPSVSFKEENALTCECTEQREVLLSPERGIPKRRDRFRDWFRRKSKKKGGKKNKGCPALKASSKSKKKLDGSLKTFNSFPHVPVTPTPRSEVETDCNLSFHTCVSNDSLVENYDNWSYLVQVTTSFAAKTCNRVPGLNRLMSDKLVPYGGDSVTNKRTNFADHMRYENRAPFSNDTKTFKPSPSLFDEPRPDDPHFYDLPLSDRANIDISYIKEVIVNNKDHSFPFLNYTAPHDFDKLGLALTGHWITDKVRCDNIEPQFKFLGIPYIKRSILSSIAIPVTIFCEDYRDEKFNWIHQWLHTPLGLRHIKWKRNGYSTDTDPDAGSWGGKVRIINAKLPGDLCIKAIQRHTSRPANPSAGLLIETRFVLPDLQHGKILVLHYSTYPRALSHNDFTTGAMHITRVCKFVHVVDNIRDLSKAKNNEACSLEGCVPISV